MGSTTGNRARLTRAQRRTLETAIAHGSIVVGGIDATPGIRYAVVLRLADMGLLRYKAPKSIFEASEWVPTLEGKQAI